MFPSWISRDSNATVIAIGQAKAGSGWRYSPLQKQNAPIQRARDVISVVYLQQLVRTVSSNEDMEKMFISLFEVQGCGPLDDERTSQLEQTTDGCAVPSFLQCLRLSLDITVRKTRWHRIGSW